MIKSLRKRHLQAWYGLAILVLAGVTLAWLSIPLQPVTTLLQPASPSALPHVMSSYSNENYTINLRCSGNHSNCQVEYINRAGITVPSLLIYIQKPGGKTIDEHELLGRIDSKGVYRFPLLAVHGNKTPGFILYDVIGKKTLDTVRLNNIILQP